MGTTGTGERRFRARIEKSGVNPYVDVPARVSRAFRDAARSGRIRVEGKLDGTPIRATIVPVASGGHRLYVNQGMRSAAGVDVGDWARFSLRPAPADERAPRDVARELARIPGATAAFRALTPGHRRELLRYIDDAKTAATRTKRVQKAAEHALGKPSPVSAARRANTLWTCPECGNEFVNKNQYHSCKRYELDDVFASKPKRIRALFDRLRTMVEACGPVKLQAYRDKVGFMVNVRFAGATPRQKWLDVGLWLTRRISNPRFRRVETIYPNAHVHSLRIAEPEELDAELARWLRESYRVGCQEHLS